MKYFVYIFMTYACWFFLQFWYKNWPLCFQSQSGEVVIQRSLDQEQVNCQQFWIEL